jgi:hypothetical protein
MMNHNYNYNNMKHNNNNNHHQLMFPKSKKAEAITNYEIPLTTTPQTQKQQITTKQTLRSIQVINPHIKSKLNIC